VAEVAVEEVVAAELGAVHVADAAIQTHPSVTVAGTLVLPTRDQSR
jgi:hypothetical protein